MSIILLKRDMKLSIALSGLGRRGSSRFTFQSMGSPLLSSSDESALDRLKFILRQPPKERVPKSLQFLINFTSSIKFFTDLVQDQSEEAHLQCCQYMTYEFLHAQEVTRYCSSSSTRETQVQSSILYYKGSVQFSSPL